VTYPESLHDGPLDGRLYLMLSGTEYDFVDAATEPRFLVANCGGGERMFARVLHACRQPQQFLAGRSTADALLRIGWRFRR